MNVKTNLTIRNTQSFRVMLITLFILLNIIFMVIIVTNNTIGDNSNKNSKIFGYVIDELTIKPITELTLFVTNQDIYYAQTNLEGYYEIDLPHSGHFKLIVHLNGYYSFESEFDIQHGQQLELNISLKPLPKETSNLNGFVFNSLTKMPINNWKVYVSGENYYNETRTNKSGYYQINIPSGNYWVSIKGNDLYYDHNTEFTINKGEIKELNLSIEPLPKTVSKVYGYVFDNFTQKPISGLDVILSEERHSSKTITDRTGYYCINIWKGHFLLWVYAEEYLNYECRINLDFGEYLLQNITLDSKRPMPVIDKPINGSKFLTSDIIKFFANSSIDLDGIIINYTWDFGDGFYRYGITTMHSYILEGMYTITLNVTDNDGRFRNTQINIVVEKESIKDNNGSGISVQFIILFGSIILIIIIILIFNKKRKQLKYEKKKIKPVKKAKKKAKLEKERKTKVKKEIKEPTRKIKKSKIERKKEIPPKKKPSEKKLPEPIHKEDKEKLSEEVEWEEDEEEEVEWH